MEDRLTHTLTTPKGHEIVFKDWINGREKQKIDGALMSGFDTDGEGDNMRPVISSTMLAAKENASIEAIIVSVDGNEIDVLNRVLDLHVIDYTFIKNHLNEIIEGDFDEKKENNSVESTTSFFQTDKEESLTKSSM